MVNWIFTEMWLNMYLAFVYHILLKKYSLFFYWLKEKLNSGQNSKNLSGSGPYHVTLYYVQIFEKLSIIVNADIDLQRVTN